MPCLLLRALRDMGKEKLEEELGDVLYALLCIANHYGIDAFQALDSTVLKYRKRDLRS